MPEDYQDSNDEEKNGSPKRTSFWSSLQKDQKIPLLVLSIFALMMVILWSIQLRKSLDDPFAYKGDTSPEATAPVDDQATSEAAQKAKDTDGDGLSDWDELNLYKTSPYLEDSDSDGFKDKEEIDAGKDPNCPTGRDCFSTINPGTSSQASTAPSVNQPASVVGTEMDAQKVLQGTSDAASLRKILLESGMDKSILDQISDEELIKTYAQTLKTPPTQ